MIVYATLLWSTREAEVALMFAGQLGCEALNFVLKRLIKEERPFLMHTTGTKGYGMPSSHAQFSFFWAVAVGLFLLVRHRPLSSSSRSSSSDSVSASRKEAAGVAVTKGREAREGQPQGLAADIERYAHGPSSFLERVMVTLVALVLATSVAWSRIYLGYHTPKQVLVGCTAGVVSALGWFLTTYILRQTGILAWALGQPPARWLRLRDLVVEEDPCQAGWEKWEARRVAKASPTARQKKRA